MMPIIDTEDIRDKPVFDKNGVPLGNLLVTHQVTKQVWKTKIVRIIQLQIDTSVKIKYPDITRNIVQLDPNLITVDFTTKKVSLVKTVEELAPSWKAK
jgi:hypothetical protein